MYLEYYTRDRAKQLAHEARQQRLARLARKDNQRSTVRFFSLPSLGQALAGLRARSSAVPAGNAVVLQTDPAECFVCG
jgi:hypothetical protein